MPGPLPPIASAEVSLPCSICSSTASARPASRSNPRSADAMSLLRTSVIAGCAGMREARHEGDCDRLELLLPHQPFTAQASSDALTCMRREAAGQQPWELAALRKACSQPSVEVWA